MIGPSTWVVHAFILQPTPKDKAQVWFNLQALLQIPLSLLPVTECPSADFA